jgi:hypothetical protein
MMAIPEALVHYTDEVPVAQRTREVALTAAALVLSNPNYKPTPGKNWSESVRGVAKSFEGYLATGVIK